MAATPAHESAVSVDPDVMSGTPVFRGTRVPIQALFDCLAAGDPLDEFFAGFPSVRPEQVAAVLDEAYRALAGQHVPSAA
jgi:uncharacterized protein (DUF433 family)